MIHLKDHLTKRIHNSGVVNVSNQSSRLNSSNQAESLMKILIFFMPCKIFNQMISY